MEIPEEHRKEVFQSLVVKAKEQDEDMEKNAKKNRKRFVELLQKTRDVTARTKYEDAEALLGASPAWDSVDDTTRRQCFEIFVDQLKIQSKGNEEEEDDGKKDKKTKTKKRKEEPPPEPEPPKKASKKKREDDPEANDDGDRKHKKHRRE